MQGRQEVLGWTLVRVVFGVMIAVAHGLPKVMDGVERHTNTVAAMGFPFPALFAWLSALAELAGGLLIAAGFFTRPVALILIVNLVVAMYRHLQQGDPFSRLVLALLFIAVFAAMGLAGAGPWSLDAKVRHRA
ncbi:MAG TPA: DoxX family protein [Hyalangium sp.]|jgi:putative oxidoreductase|nr:DoxX family protein [Hyalangium sp.]